MSIVRIEKKCPACGKKYLFNPDVGVGLVCPNCLGQGPIKKSLWDKLKKKTNK